MKMGSWNVRRLNGEDTIRELRLIIYPLRIQVSKMSGADLDFIHRLGGTKLQGWGFKPVFRRKGDLFYFGTLILYCTGLHYRDFSMTANFRNRKENVFWTFTRVYGPKSQI